MSTEQKIVGRYAPSPTGELHLGNLRTALLAWLQVRLAGGDFLLRMEDIDTPRVVKGADKKILTDLELLGIDWDGDVVYQSKRTSLYQDAIDSLKSDGLIYPCFCSRKDIQQASSAPHSAGAIYTGVCRDLSDESIGIKSQKKMPALRLKVDSGLAKEAGDFVVKRADNLFAYQLVVVVDDLEQGVTDVLRGEDLIDSTDRQLYLAQLLKPCNHQQIRYKHVPLMRDDSGARLSKRDGSISLDAYLAKNASPEQLVAELAESVGLIDKVEPLTANELLVYIRNGMMRFFDAPA